MARKGFLQARLETGHITPTYIPLARSSHWSYLSARRNTKGSPVILDGEQLPHHPHAHFHPSQSLTTHLLTLQFTHLMPQLLQAFSHWDCGSIDPTTSHHPLSSSLFHCLNYLANYHNGSLAPSSFVTRQNLSPS